MRKFKKLTALLIAVIVVVGAFAPAALAADAPSSWSNWTLQKKGDGNYSTTYTYAIQRFLNKYFIGYFQPQDECYAAYPLSVDGVFGSNTEMLVKRFQSINVLTVDGKVGSATWTAMYGKLYEFQTGGGGVTALGDNTDVVDKNYYVGAAVLANTDFANKIYHRLGSKWYVSRYDSNLPTYKICD